MSPESTPIPERKEYRVFEASEIPAEGWVLEKVLEEDRLEHPMGFTGADGIYRTPLPIRVRVHRFLMSRTLLERQTTWEIERQKNEIARLTSQNQQLRAEAADFKSFESELSSANRELTRLRSDLTAERTARETALREVTGVKGAIEKLWLHFGRRTMQKILGEDVECPVEEATEEGIEGPDAFERLLAEEPFDGTH